LIAGNDSDFRVIFLPQRPRKTIVFIPGIDTRRAATMMSNVRRPTRRVSNWAEHRGEIEIRVCGDPIRFTLRSCNVAI
jgi:hypothetical protein